MKPTHRDGILRGGRALLIRVLIVAAAAISAYLLSVSMRGGSVMGCAPGSSCDVVLQSRWAYVLGIPVSALALVVDLALLLTTFSLGPNSKPRQRRGAWEILVACAVLLLGAAFWFTALQAFVLRQFCPWCLAAHGCGAVAAILLLSRVPVAHTNGPRDRDPSVPRAKMMRLAAVSMVLIAILGAAQALVARKTHQMSNLPGPTSTAVVTAPIAAVSNPVSTSQGVATDAPSTPVPAQPTAPVPSATAGARTFDVFGGRFRLDMNEVPVWGPVDAPLKLLSLYDYTCHHCRDMHSRVVDVKKAFGDQLAVVSLPMPLDAQCNALMRQTPPAHRNACVYARLGLIVWRAKREAIEPFDDWFFAFQTPPSLTEVTNKAIELVGTAAFEQASRDPSIQEKISTSIAIYGVSGREFRHGSMPQFMIGTNIVSGVLTTEQLRKVVENYARP